MAKCKNPECINGLCPGVKIVGGGKTSAPLFGQGASARIPKMVWAWVNCLACSPKPKDPAFVLKRRSPEEMAQRAEWASQGVPYKPDSETAARLARVASRSKAPGNGHASSTPPENSGLLAKIDKLVDGQNELLEQMRELRAENKALKVENERLKSVGGQPIAN